MGSPTRSSRGARRRLEGDPHPIQPPPRPVPCPSGPPPHPAPGDPHPILPRRRLCCCCSALPGAGGAGVGPPGPPLCPCGAQPRCPGDGRSGRAAAEAPRVRPERRGARPGLFAASAATTKGGQGAGSRGKATPLAFFEPEVLVSFERSRAVSRCGSASVGFWTWCLQPQLCPVHILRTQYIHRSNGGLATGVIKFHKWIGLM